MSLSQMLFPEFDQEMGNTRKTLQRVPEDRFEWKPHAKSYSLAGLTTHLSNLPNWAIVTVNQSEFDMAPPGQGPLRDRDPGAHARPVVDDEPEMSPGILMRRLHFHHVDKLVTELDKGVPGALGAQREVEYLPVKGERGFDVADLDRDVVDADQPRLRRIVFCAVGHRRFSWPVVGPAPTV